MADPTLEGIKAKFGLLDANTPLDDGDNVTVNGTATRVGGIDAPETTHFKEKTNTLTPGNPGGTASAEILAREMAGGARVQQTGEIDEYGRPITRIERSNGEQYSEYAIGVGAARPTKWSTEAEQGAEFKALMRSTGQFRDMDDPAALADFDKMQAAKTAEATGLDPYMNVGTSGFELPGTFMNAVRRGAATFRASTAGFSFAAGELVGYDPLKDWGEDKVRSAMLDAAMSPAELESIDDVDSLAKLGTYVTEAVGENLVNLGVSAATYGAGGLVGKGAMAGIGKAALQRMGVTNAAKVGARAGGFLGSYVPSVGEVQNELSEGGVSAPGTAFFAGIPIAALDAAGIDRLASIAFRGVNKVTAEGWLKQALPTLLKGVGHGTLAEAPTEAMQEAIVIAARAFHDPSFILMSPENLNRIAEAGIKGGIVGGVAGGAGGSANLATNKLLAKPAGTVPPVVPPPGAGPTNTDDSAAAGSADGSAIVSPNQEAPVTGPAEAGGPTQAGPASSDPFEVAPGGAPSPTPLAPGAQSVGPGATPSPALAAALGAAQEAGKPTLPETEAQLAAQQESANAGRKDAVFYPKGAKIPPMKARPKTVALKVPDGTLVVPQENAKRLRAEIAAEGAEVVKQRLLGHDPGPKPTAPNTIVVQGKDAAGQAVYESAVDPTQVAKVAEATTTAMKVAGPGGTVAQVTPLAALEERVPGVSPRETKKLARTKQRAKQSAKEAAAEAKAAETPPTDFHDERLQRSQYRQGLAVLAQTEILPGGGGAGALQGGQFTPDPDGSLTFAQMHATDVTRQPSLNASWVQNMLAETGLSAAEVKAAIKKALRGEKLGKRQQQAVDMALNEIESRREDAARSTRSRRDADLAKREARAEREAIQLEQPLPKPKAAPAPTEAQLADAKKAAIVAKVAQRRDEREAEQAAVAPVKPAPRREVTEVTGARDAEQPTKKTKPVFRVAKTKADQVGEGRPAGARLVHGSKENQMMLVDDNGAPLEANRQVDPIKGKLLAQKRAEMLRKLHPKSTFTVQRVVGQGKGLYVIAEDAPTEVSDASNPTLRAQVARAREKGNNAAKRDHNGKWVNPTDIVRLVAEGVDVRRRYHVRELVRLGRMLRAVRAEDPKGRQFVENTLVEIRESFLAALAHVAAVDGYAPRTTAEGGIAIPANTDFGRGITWDDVRAASSDPLTTAEDELAAAKREQAAANAAVGGVGGKPVINESLRPLKVAADAKVEKASRKLYAVRKAGEESTELVDENDAVKPEEGKDSKSLEKAAAKAVASAQSEVAAAKLAQAAANDLVGGVGGKPVLREDMRHHKIAADARLEKALRRLWAVNNGSAPREKSKVDAMRAAEEEARQELKDEAMRERVRKSRGRELNDADAIDRMVIDERNKMPRVDNAGESTDARNARSAKPGDDVAAAKASEVPQVVGDVRQVFGVANIVGAVSEILKSVGVTTRVRVMSSTSLREYIKELETELQALSAKNPVLGKRGVELRAQIEGLKREVARSDVPSTIIYNDHLANAADRVPIILMRDDTKFLNNSEALYALGHELGHLVQRATFDQMPAEHQKALREALKGDFDERFADEFVKFVAAHRPARNALERAYAHIARVLRRTWHILRLKKWTAHEDFLSFIAALYSVSQGASAVGTDPVTAGYMRVLQALEKSPVLPYRKGEFSSADFNPMDAGRKAVQATSAYVARRRAEGLLKWANDVKDGTGNALDTWLGPVGYTADGRLREMTVVGRDGVTRTHELMEFIANQFHLKAGDSRAKGFQTIIQEIRARSAVIDEAFAEVSALLPKSEGKLRALFDENLKQSNTDAEAKLERIGDALLSHKPLAEIDEDIRAEVKAVRGFYEKLIKEYLPEGAKPIEGYSPFVFDLPMLMGDKAEFVKALTEFKTQLGLESDADIEGIYEAIVTGNGLTYLDESNASGIVAPRNKFLDQRSWPKELRARLNKFYVKDPRAVMLHYGHAAVKAKVWRERLGWDALPSNVRRQIMKRSGTSGDTEMVRLELIKKGVVEANDALWAVNAGIAVAGQITPDQRQVAHTILDGYAGRLGAKMDPRLRRLYSYLTLYQNTRLLTFAVLSSLMDIGVLATRVLTSGDFNSWKALGASFRGQNRKNLEMYARAIGAIRDQLTEHVLNDQFLNTYITPDAAKMNQAYFTMIGMHHWTNATRIAAMAWGQEFLVANAQDGDARSLANLKELGVTAEEVLAWEAGGRQPRENPNVDMALQTFIDQSVMRPDAPMRPVWMSDARFSPFAHLKTFMFTFHKTVLDRVWSQSKTSAKQGEYLRAALPMVVLASMTLPLAAAGYELRRWIADWPGDLGIGKENAVSPAPKGGAYFWEVVQRSGMLGAFQLMADANTAEQRDRSSILALAGPTAGQFAAFLEDGVAGFSRRAIPFAASFPGLRP